MLISMPKKLVSYEWSDNSAAINVKLDGSVFEGVTLFLNSVRSWDCLSSKLDSASYYIVSIAKIVTKKIRALIRFLKVFSSEIALYLYESTAQPCIEYCCHVWADVPSYYLDMFDELQKWICSTVGRTFATSVEPLTQC